MKGHLHGNRKQLLLGEDRCTERRTRLLSGLSVWLEAEVPRMQGLFPECSRV